MVYLLKMVIFHGKLLNNQMVNKTYEATNLFIDLRGTKSCLVWKSAAEKSCRTTHFEQLNQSFRVYLPFIPIPVGSHHVPHSFMAIFKEIWPRQGHRPTEHKALADSRPKCGNIAVKPAQSFPRKIPDGQRRPSSSCPDSFLLCQF
jgi:hypothetical protein